MESQPLPAGAGKTQTCARDRCGPRRKVTWDTLKSGLQESQGGHRDPNEEEGPLEAQELAWRSCLVKASAVEAPG